MNTEEIIKALECEKSALQSKIDSLNDTIQIIKQSHYKQERSIEISDEVKLNNKSDKEFASLTISQQVALIFKQEQRFLHKREIAKIAATLDSTLDERAYGDKLVIVLSRLRKQGVIILVKADNQNVNTFYGSVNWLDKDGAILPKFKYDESVVFKNSESEKIVI